MKYLQMDTVWGNTSGNFTPQRVPGVSQYQDSEDQVGCIQDSASLWIQQQTVRKGNCMFMSGGAQQY